MRIRPARVWCGAQLDKPSLKPGETACRLTLACLWLRNTPTESKFSVKNIRLTLLCSIALGRNTRCLGYDHAHNYAHAAARSGSVSCRNPAV